MTNEKGVRRVRISDDSADDEERELNDDVHTRIRTLRGDDGGLHFKNESKRNDTENFPGKH